MAYVKVLNVDSVVNAIRRRVSEKELPKILDEALKIGEQTANAELATLTMFDPTEERPHASVRIEKKDALHGSLIADGDAIWIEFGTGVRRNAGQTEHEWKGEFGLSNWGEYGKKHEQNPYGWWDENGNHHYGIIKTPFMLEASKAIKEYLNKKARG